MLLTMDERGRLNAPHLSDDLSLDVARGARNVAVGFRPLVGARDGGPSAMLAR